METTAGTRRSGRDAPTPVVPRTAPFDSKRTLIQAKDPGGETLVRSLEPERVWCYGYVRAADTLLSPGVT